MEKLTSTQKYRLIVQKLLQVQKDTGENFLTITIIIDNLLLTKSYVTIEMSQYNNTHRTFHFYHHKIDKEKSFSTHNPMSRKQINLSALYKELEHIPDEDLKTILPTVNLRERW